MYQSGVARVRLPRPVVPVRPEAVLINTAGGLTGGDRLDQRITLGPDAAVTVSTQACEKIYRSSGGTVICRTELDAGSGARLDWLPQPAIVFDRSELDRRLVVSVAGDASLIAAEALILGRAAMDETVRQGRLRDSIEIRRDGRLAYADCFRADDDLADAFAPSAALGTARALGMVLICAPDAASRLDETRNLFSHCRGDVGASAWNGLMAVRFLSTDGAGLIADMSRVLTALRGQVMPRVWAC